VRWENKNTCRWPVLLVISVPKIFLNGQFYFNLSSKTWSHVFFGTQCRFPIGGGGGGMSYSLHHVKGGNCPSGENVRGNMSGQTA